MQATADPPALQLIWYVLCFTLLMFIANPGLCSLLELARRPAFITDLSRLPEPLVLALLQLLLRGLKMNRRLLQLFRATGYESVLL